MNKESWISHFIVPSTGKIQPSASETNQASNDDNLSHRIYSGRIVPKNNDPRSFMIVTASFLFADMDPVFFDPDLDPSNKACFNCRKEFGITDRRHNHYTCPKPKQREYCKNCGRQGIDIKTCPRCARGYRDYAERGFTGKFVKKTVNTVSKSGASKVESHNGVGGKVNSSSTNRQEAFYDIEKVESDNFVHLDTEKVDKRDICSNLEAFNEKNFISENNVRDRRSQSNDERKRKVLNQNLDDSYDGVIVDEDERTEITNSMNKTVQDFLSIMDALKPLTIESQSIVALEFVKMQREQTEKKENVKTKTK